MAYIVYILLCSDNTLYTGITNDLENRIKTHQSGKGSKYVRARLPVKILHLEQYEDRSSASKREYEIKSWSRDKKIKSLKLKINP